jgi:MFS transporter, DHA1 family, multidrug resistance protein
MSLPAPHTAPTPHQHHDTPKWALALMLAALGMLGPFAIDTYIPAFAGMGQQLQVTPLQMQQTLSVYLAGFAVMMLFHGALSDAYGRKPVILVGLVFFCIGSAGCALSTTLTQLLFFRAVQGISVGAGMVVGRAMIRDLYAGADAQRLMAMVTLWFGLAPAIAPIIGGYFFVWFGWQSIFWLLTGFTALLLISSAYSLHETLPVTARQSFRPRALLAGYREVGMNVPFILLSLAMGLNFNGFFLYFMSAPVYLPETLKLLPTQFAYLFIPGILGVMAGATISGRVAGKWNTAKTINTGYKIMLSAAALNMLYNATMTPSVPWAMAPIFLYAIGSSLSSTALAITVLDMFPTRRGMAASLQSFVSAAVNVVVAGIISPLAYHSAGWMAFSMLALVGTGWVCWIVSQKMRTAV